MVPSKTLVSIRVSNVNDWLMTIDNTLLDFKPARQPNADHTIRLDIFREIISDYYH